MYIKTTGLVLRETEYKETSRILTVLTASDGKITVSARGARRKGSKTAASAQLLTYSDMVIFGDRGRYVLTESRTIEEFRGLRDDFALLSLGSYFAELLESVADEDQPSPEILALGLNALYALGEKKKNPDIVKAAFELRLAALAGFEPQLNVCAGCGCADVGGAGFSVPGGVVYCGKCAADGGYETIKLLPGTLEAMRYIISADSKKIYSFSAGEDSLKQLNTVCECYLLTQLDRRFKTLDFYKSVK